MDSTYAAIGAVAPSQTEFAAFADAMSTSYGAPIELVSADPFSGAQTELADTSVGNLLAELPALETQANGVNLGLQLADGTQVQFASTARLAIFLYSLAVQQMQATSFVTDNYNLDMQWLNTVDQPLLQEGVYWSERATAEAPVYPERTVEDNVQAEQAFSGGENVQAILSLAQAVGMRANGFGAAQTAQIVSAAAQGVGNGNATGVLAGALEAAAAGAAGIGLYNDGQTQAMLQSISTALTTAGVATAVASDFASGNLAQGLVDSLNLYLPIIAGDYVAAQAAITPGTVDVDNISPTPDMLGVPQHLAFVGGFFDYTESVLLGPNARTTYNEYLQYAKAYPTVDVRYFTWNNTVGLTAWGNQVDAGGGQITLIGHSYGVAIAASVVANGLKVQTLVTLDPVSYLQPDFQQVAARGGLEVDQDRTLSVLPH